MRWRLLGSKWRIVRPQTGLIVKRKGAKAAGGREGAHECGRCGGVARQGGGNVSQTKAIHPLHCDHEMRLLRGIAGEYRGWIEKGFSVVDDERESGEGMSTDRRSSIWWQPTMGAKELLVRSEDERT
jgi:hypothetical protein